MAESSFSLQRVERPACLLELPTGGIGMCSRVIRGTLRVVASSPGVVRTALRGLRITRRLFVHCLTQFRFSRETPHLQRCGIEGILRRRHSSAAFHLLRSCTSLRTWWNCGQGGGECVESERFELDAHPPGRRSCRFARRAQ